MAEQADVGTQRRRPPQRVGRRGARARDVLVVALHGPRSSGVFAQVTRFAWHFMQMAVAMTAGMLPLGMALSAAGRQNLDTQSPEAYALAMTVAMVIPMVAWMRVLGHGWERTGEMAGAMTVPVVVLAAASSLGLLPHSATTTGMNVVMWAGMLAAMLFRWREYARSCHPRAGRTAPR